MPAAGPPPGLGQVRAITTTFLTDADAQWSRTADRLDQSFAEVATGLAHPGGTEWRGAAADDAQTRGMSDLMKARAVSGQLHDAAAIARRGAGQLDSARRGVLDAVDAATADDFEVGDDYSVTDLWTGGDADFHAARHALAVQHAEYIWHKVTALSALDRQLARDIAGATDGVKEFSFDEKPADTPGDDADKPPKDRLAEILEQYQVSDDPNGIVEWEPGWPMSLFTDPKPITAGEAEVLDGLSVFGLRDMDQIKDAASETAKVRFPPPTGRGNGEVDTQTDAFRHAYWNALMTKRFGAEWTRNFATAHERLPGNYSSSEAMDLYNNEMGRSIAVANPNASPDQLADLVEQSVRGGQAVVINEAGTGLLWSNQVTDGGFPEASKNSAPTPGLVPNLPTANPGGGYAPGNPGGTTYGDYG